MAFIRINRKLFDHFLWKENRIYSRAEAWIDLIQLMSYTKDATQREKMINGVLVKWERGQYPISHSFLAQRWNWSTHKVRTFINLLKSEKQVSTISTNVTTILTLCNYDIYNPISQAEEQADVQADGRRTAGSKEREEREEGKKEKIEKEIFISESQKQKKEEEWIIQNRKEVEEFMNQVMPDEDNNQPNF